MKLYQIFIILNIVGIFNAIFMFDVPLVPALLIQVLFAITFWGGYSVRYLEQNKEEIWPNNIKK